MSEVKYIRDQEEWDSAPEVIAEWKQEWNVCVSDESHKNNLHRPLLVYSIRTFWKYQGYKWQSFKREVEKVARRSGRFNRAEFETHYSSKVKSNW